MQNGIILRPPENAGFCTIPSLAEPVRFVHSDCEATNFAISYRYWGGHNLMALWTFWWVATPPPTKNSIEPFFFEKRKTTGLVRFMRYMDGEVDKA